MNEKGLVNDEVLKIDLNVSDRLKQLKRGVQVNSGGGCGRIDGSGGGNPMNGIYLILVFLIAIIQRVRVNIYNLH